MLSDRQSWLTSTLCVRLEPTHGGTVGTAGDGVLVFLLVPLVRAFSPAHPDVPAWVRVSESKPPMVTLFQGPHESGLQGCCRLLLLSLLLLSYPLYHPGL